MIKIYKQPVDWQDLEKKVATLLLECGYSEATKKVVKSSRGKREIDVYAINIIDGREYTTLCECKYWNTPVPQTIIDAFATVINNIGANEGYIISKKGFQSGALEASSYTNIKLVTWGEFETIYFKSWYRNFFYKNVTQIIKDEYSFLPMMKDDIQDSEKNKFSKLCKKYNDLIEISHLMTQFNCIVEGKEVKLPYIPILITDIFAPLELPITNSLFKNKMNWEKEEYYNTLGHDFLDEIIYSEFLNKFRLLADEVYNGLKSLGIQTDYEK